MKTFVEWAKTQSFVKIKSVADHVILALKRIVSVNTKVNETFSSNDVMVPRSYSSERNQYEKKLFAKNGDDPKWNCNFLCRFVRKYYKNYENTGKAPYNKCGTEGCAYFVSDDHVLKCTLGKDEFFVADKCKGKLDIVPVIDTAREPATGVYLILMNKMIVDNENEIMEVLDEVGSCVKSYFQAMESSKTNVTIALDINNFQNHIKTGVYATECAKHPKQTIDLFNIILEIFKSTGFFLHKDLHSANLGLTPDKKKIQIIDLGYPAKYGQTHNLDLDSDSDSYRSF